MTQLIAGARSQVAGTGPQRTPDHRYYFNGRGPWPGVTSITDVLDKPQLTNWKREQVALLAIQYAERLLEDRQANNAEASVRFLLGSRDAGRDARDRGTRIHAVLDAMLRRQPATVLPGDVGAVEGARLWLNEHNVQPLAIEMFLINEALGYGGTCDLIADIAGEIWLLDWKTSKSVANAQGKLYVEHNLQLEAYRRAEYMALPGDDQPHEIPAITRCGILHVTDTGTRLYEADITEDDWTTFRACLWIYNWQKHSGKAR